MNANASPLRVLVVGASGNFGARLTRLLALEPGVRTLACGRRSAPLEALAAGLVGVEACPGDRAGIDAAWLAARRVDVVVDASGPFQLADASLIEAAIAAGAHYADLADDRDFVLGVRRFDASARAAGVAVVSGASSTPGLSHAALDELTRGWCRIDAVEALISPSNRQRVGPAVARAMLARLGRPLRTFEDGAWTARTGWGSPRAVRLPGAGRRLAAPVDVADQELLVERYRPTRAARFEAALGLPIEQRALGVLAALVRSGALGSGLPFATWGLRAVNALTGLGRDVGVMRVRAAGLDATGTPVRAEWCLRATGRTGPAVPTLAALAVVRRLHDGTLAPGPVGATPCAGLLRLEDFAPELERLGIRTALTVRTTNARAGDAKGVAGAAAGAAGRARATRPAAPRTASPACRG